MKKINIYITQIFKGRLDSGEGRFCIYLELVNRDGTANPNTRMHKKGYTGTTKNRLALLSCIEALSHVTECCEITIHIDSHYMAGNEGKLSRWEESGWICGQGQIKNRDLWKRYMELADNHQITVVAEKEHSFRHVAYRELQSEVELYQDSREDKKEERKDEQNV